MPIPIIFDTDPGVDDAMALLLALASPELAVLGVTTVFGNSQDLALLTRNALALCALGGRPEVPVAAGTAHPLTRTYTGRANLVHGDNALGGVQLPEPVQRPDTRFGPQFIVDMCRERRGQVTLVAVGPLTNLALALRIDPKLPTYVPRVAIMGGSARAGGNITPAAEFNIYADPEAARLVFNAGWEIIMAGLDVTCSPRVAEPYFERLAKRGNRCGQFLASASQHYLQYYHGQGYAGVCMHDVHAVMALIRPELYRSERVYIDVETAGELTRGQTVVDWRGRLGKAAQTTLLLGADETAFLNLFAERIGTLP